MRISNVKIRMLSKKVKETAIHLDDLGPALDEVTPLRIADGFQRITDHHAACPGDFA